jgi:hypothetical protein
LQGAGILVAEDDAILAFDIMDLLRKAGADVLRRWPMRSLLRDRLC